MPLAPLFSLDTGVTAGYSRCGKGGIIVIASSWAISNAGIARGDNLALVLNAADYGLRGNGRVITFDEFHHGYGRREGILSLIDLPARLGLIQIGIAFLVLVFGVSRRFGRPIPLMEGARQRSEYLSSMSSLLGKAHATRFARAELGRRFMGEVAVALGLSPNCDPEAIVQAARERRPDMAQEIDYLVRQAATYRQTDIEESALVALAARWHKMRKELTKTR